MTIISTLDDQILRWKINVPQKGNSLGITVANALNKKMNQLQTDIDSWEKSGFDRKTAPCRGLIIEAAEGGRKGDVWIAGGDLHELSKLNTPTEGRRYAESLSSFCRAMEELPIPVIAKINGSAIGGGAELALAADLRIGGPKTSFEFKQLFVGLATGYSSSHRLIQTTGLANAKKLLFQGTKLNAADCLQYGLLSDLAPSKKHLDKLIKEVTDNLTTIEPRSFAAQKKMLRIACTTDYSTSQASDLELFESLWMNPTHKNFLNQFTKKQSK